MTDYPNARDCEHGQLRRSCEICALREENENIRREVTHWRDRTEDLAAELAVANERGDGWRAKFNEDTDRLAGLCEENERLRAALAGTRELLRQVLMDWVPDEVVRGDPKCECSAHRAMALLREKAETE